MPTSGFSRNIWFLIPISMGGKSGVTAEGTRGRAATPGKLNVKTGPRLLF